MAASEVWNVFVPLPLLNQSSVYLTGQIDHSKASVYVTGVSLTYARCESDPVVGYLTSSETDSPNRNQTGQRRRQIWLTIFKSESAAAPCCRLCLPNKPDPCRCVCVIFEPKDVISSYIFTEEQGKCTNAESHIRGLLNVYGKYCSYDLNPTDKTLQSPSRKNSVSLVERIFVWIQCLLIAVFSVVDWILSVVSLKWCWTRMHAQVPALVGQTAFKLIRFKKLRSACASSLKSNLMLFDICGQQLLDSVLGVSIMLFVMHTSCADTLAAAVMHWADDTASYLNDLLHWLMGAPAGLKLNAQLTEYMGHFFIYHVYLWSGYLSVLRPMLSWVIRAAAVLGTLGISAQLCFVQDVVSMLTLHIYCFYVYAARLYSLQVYALSSLWRLFRGKKWNVLRLRVDSALYNVDQLCIGTLLFTVLLFLLPTTLLYYFVFASLRLVVLTFHGVVSVAIESINTIPAATCILRIIKSKFVAGDLLFNAMHDQGDIEKNKCLILSMQTTQLPMKRLYRSAIAHMQIEAENQEQHKYSWTELLQRLVSGHLVYPWVDPHNDSKEKLS